MSADRILSRQAPFYAVFGEGQTSNPSFSARLKYLGVTLNSVAVYAGSRVFYVPGILVTFGDNAISHIFDAKNQKSVRFYDAFWSF